MATLCSTISTSSSPPFLSKPSPPFSSPTHHRSLPLFGSISCRRLSLKRLQAAGLHEIEPDLVEEKRDRWATNGVSADDFVYGEYDGHHTYYEGHSKETFWESVVSEFKASEAPTGFQGLLSWLFIPTIIGAMVYHVLVIKFIPCKEYMYIGAAIFVVIFCGIEMGKPDEPHNFTPQIYSMERAARDKLIADYNTVDIWDFNEKYGELWDFTVKNDDLVK